jgi:hypothetical protein
VRRTGAQRAAIISVFSLLACVVALVFDVIFVMNRDTCILTSACREKADLNTNFSYNLQKPFLTFIRKLKMFEGYGEFEVKQLCQYVQIGLLGFSTLNCLVYLLIYMMRNKQTARVQHSGALVVTTQCVTNTGGQFVSTAAHIH